MSDRLIKDLIVGGIAWGWSPSPIDGRIALWVYMDGEPPGLLTMTADQQTRLREALDVFV